jgi:hypothetical protein
LAVEARTDRGVKSEDKKEGEGLLPGRVPAMWRREEPLRSEMGDDQRVDEDQKDERWMSWE